MGAGPQLLSSIWSDCPRNFLNRVILIGLTVLYGLFCAFTLMNVLTMTTIHVGALDELRLAETISEVGIAALTASIRWGGVNGLIALLLFFGTSFGTVIYLWYRFCADKYSRLDQ